MKRFGSIFGNLATLILVLLICLIGLAAQAFGWEGAAPLVFLGVAPLVAGNVFTPDRLIAGEFPRVTAGGILLAGQALPRGALLGKVALGGGLKLCGSAEVPDGSEDPYAILAVDCDATLADAACPIYLTGEFNEAAVIFGSEDTADTHRDALRAIGIHLKSTVPAYTQRPPEEEGEGGDGGGGET
jgi:hypothetical protein